MFSKNSLPLLDTFIEEKKVHLSSPTCDVNSDPVVFLFNFHNFSLPQEAPIEEKDAPGNFVSWLIPR